MYTVLEGSALVPFIETKLQVGAKLKVQSELSYCEDQGCYVCVVSTMRV